MYIHHNWNLNDVIEVNLDQNLYAEPMPDNPDRISMKYGPIVLAADLGHNPPDELEIPVITNPDRNITTWTKQSISSDLEFYVAQTDALPKMIRLKPFYQLYDSYYNVYFDYMHKKQWDLKVDAYEAEKKRIKS